jgi:hypothetical protein
MKGTAFFRLFKIGSILLLSTQLFACGIHAPDYTLYRQHLPRSILVLPPVNNTAESEASSLFLASISRPLAERGYYVPPVVLVDKMLRENGVVSPVEMREVSHKKLKEIFGTDAVLDIAIDEWGTNYHIIGSSTVVRFSYRLIDLGTGLELWQGVGAAKDEGRSGDGDLAGALIGALVHATVNSIKGPEVELARNANYAALHNENTGLLPGPRLPRE